MGTGKDLWLQFETLYSRRDWDGAASLFADDAVHIDPTGRHEGREAIRVWCEQGGAAFSDLGLPASLLIEDVDIVVAEYVFRAMFTGPLTFPDGTVLPPTGNPQELPCVTISEVSDGKFVAMRDYFDLSQSPR